jgi:hypothetical protein
MDFHIKLVQLTEKGNHLIVITRGLIDAGGFKLILRRIAGTSQALSQCMIMIDLEDAELKLDPADFDAIASEVDPAQWHVTNKIALVSSSAANFDQLLALSQALCNRGLNVAAFSGDKAAVQWLSGSTKT